MRNKLSGFTLLEILIALFIFTIVSVIMASGLHSVLNSQAATEKKANSFAEIQMAVLLISRDMEQAINRPITNAKNILEGGMVGGPRSVTFTHAGLHNPEGELQRSTLQRVRYFIEKNELTRETWEVLDQSAKTESVSRVLLNSAEDLHFEYLDEKRQFQKNWPPADKQNAGLPRAIRMNLTLKNWGKISQIYLLVGDELDAKPQ